MTEKDILVKTRGETISKIFPKKKNKTINKQPVFIFLQLNKQNDRSRNKKKKQKKTKTFNINTRVLQDEHEKIIYTHCTWCLINR